MEDLYEMILIEEPNYIPFKYFEPKPLSSYTLVFRCKRTKKFSYSKDATDARGRLLIFTEPHSRYGEFFEQHQLIGVLKTDNHKEAKDD
jgi:hypothetical protein